ncbi:uncharacterized protein LOC124276852 [Haliotis rubra]|uniref:uncharacterized protein LOC124276852 n=1 Tax=Haliotis rubra TaxID=36100 RepID=UPI001EE5569D|nr:uncharacterized protein LOC124276852 [Haliotis rubra]XP_046568460.1 uncharacterized protein LOC124276852 [Haliotis rubra]XP_046568461.1 uncharacterized protein LOC124276852 [Haliotis rubra]XP_046568462.1 uncharacterized protein LOC124276852 [Haliotis rubra]XP_046568463.1 uncharacterized protein LOC124276852 [Haliotis rubra]XP_046568464.1 uncharacterized protein LOC124276852 [Haliotis rubra]XP_046568465.1 uncharacterized protein LOC124276852 [Haliotis rubra]XP_046568466.1 uncharacterized p
MILEQSLREKKMVELPPLSLYSMTKPQLEEFIPRLINISCPGRTPSPPAAASSQFYKPEWWPVDIPWAAPCVTDSDNLLKQFAGGDCESTDKLRSVVQACYEYMGHTELLTRTNSADDVTSLKNNADVLSVNSSDDESDSEVVDVYVCFYCDRWFGGKNGKSKLEEHVLTHMENEYSVSIQSDRASDIPQTSAVSVQSNCPKTCPPKSTPFLPRPRKRRLEMPLWKRHDLPCNNGVQQSDFLKSFGLLSSKQAKNVVSKSKSDMDIDCEIVAVEGLDSRPLTSPRTPRSLMSQLSRDGEGTSRKRLSFSVPDDASDGEATEATSPSKNIQGALLNVPFSSLLGKRVKKHIKPDSSVCTIKDVEEHCSTVVRNEFLDKLRYRSNDYPVTYKKKRKHCFKHIHEYKFNKEQKFEFLRKMRTGLNKQSRLLKRQMGRCKVVLKRVSKEEIQFWREKKGSRGAEWIDDDISIVEIQPPPITDRSKLYYCTNSGVTRQVRPMPMQAQRRHQNILQLRTQQNARVSGAVPSQYCIQPRPQFLVRKVEKQFNGHQSSKLVYVPINEQPAGPKKRVDSHTKIPHSGQMMKTWGEHTMVADRRLLGPASSSRRKQHFLNLRKELADDVSVHSESSEDDYVNAMNKSGQRSLIQKRDSSVPHMVMSASGGYIKTVAAPQAVKTFGNKVAVTNVPTQRHFTSHPVQKSDSPKLWSVKPRPEHSSLGYNTSTGMSVPSVYKSEAAKMKSGGSTVPVCTTKPVQATPWHVVDDVIYIDDD